MTSQTTCTYRNGSDFTCFMKMIVPRRYFCCGSYCSVFWSRIFVLFEPYVRFHILVKFGYLSGRLLRNSCSLGLRYVFWYKYLNVILVFSHPSVCGMSSFLIAPFPDHCLLLPFEDPFCRIRIYKAHCMLGFLKF